MIKKLTIMLIMALVLTSCAGAKDSPASKTVQVTPEPEEVPESEPEETPESEPEETPESEPEETPESKPEGVPESEPEETPEVVSEPEPEPAPAPEAIPEPEAVSEVPQDSEAEMQTEQNSEQLPADFTEWVPYNTSSMETLAQNLANGNVIYYNGQYWASPAYANMLSNEIVVYQHDVSQDSDAGNADRYWLIDM